MRDTSPNQHGIAGTDWEEVWIVTEESAILLIGPPYSGMFTFFPLKEAHFPAYSLPPTISLRNPWAQGVTSTGDEAPDTDWVTVIESNIDNMTGELLGGLMERLLAAGVLDVSYIPIQMKKNRPAVRITVLCQLEEGDRMAQLLLSETSTLGVRIQQVQRLKAQRAYERIETPVGTMLVKIKRLGTRVISAAPEYEECRKIALERNMSLEDVYEVAQKAIEVKIYGLQGLA